MIIFLFKKKYKSWWKWLWSGLNGDKDILDFLIIEKSISKLGYQSSKAIKKGDTKVLFWWIAGMHPWEGESERTNFQSRKAAERVGLG